MDDVDTNRKFAESLSLDYPILSDPGGETARAFGVVDDDRSLPRRWTFFIGEDGSILRVDRSVDPATAGQDIVRTLEALGVERADVESVPR